MAWQLRISEYLAHRHSGFVPRRAALPLAIANLTGYRERTWFAHGPLSSLTAPALVVVRWYHAAA